MEDALFDSGYGASPSTASTASIESQKNIFRISSFKRSKAYAGQTIGAFRSRKAHTKSRAGCKNCKQRKIKCDESKPECSKCKAFRITCDYKPTLSNALRRIPRLDALTQRNGVSHKQFTMSLAMAATSLNNSLQSDSGNERLDELSILETLKVSSINLEILHHFFSSTSYTVGSPLAQRVARSDLMKIALRQPYLMHSVLAVSAAHFHRLSPHNRTHRLAEIYHWQQTIVLFQSVISKPINVEDMDAVLSTCMVLAMLSFSTERFDPSKSWVFSSDPQALGWLQQQGGLRGLLAELKDHLQKSVWISVFNDSDDEFDTYSDVRSGIIGLPPAFVELCELDDTSTVNNNPYHAPVRLITPLISLKGGIETFTKRIPFMGRIQPPFYQLLLDKDPRALLIICWWFASMIELDQWWFNDRVRSECFACCMYLEKLGDPRILSLLEIPAQACGYPLRRPDGKVSSPLVFEIMEGCM